MEQKKFAGWIRWIVIGLSVIAAVVYLWFLPSFGRGMAQDYPEFAYAFWPWLIFLWGTAVPVAAALFMVWRIAKDIGTDRSFSRENGSRLRTVSVLAALDGAYFWAGNLVFLLLGMSHPGIFLMCHLAVFVAVAIAVAAAALSHLTFKAAQMQEEQDLTV